MNTLKINQILEDTAYVHMGGREEELKCATLLKEQIENLGVNAQIIPFEVQDYNVTKAVLKSNDKTYEVSGIKGSGSQTITAPFYYMETTTDIDKYEIDGKIVLINGVVNVPIYKKLLKYNAKAFISYSGDITDTIDNSDLENKELRDVLRNKGIIPAVHMRTSTAIELVRDNPKEIIQRN